MTSCILLHGIFVYSYQIFRRDSQRSILLISHLLTQPTSVTLLVYDDQRSFAKQLRDVKLHRAVELNKRTTRTALREPEAQTFIDAKFYSNNTATERLSRHPERYCIRKSTFCITLLVFKF